MKHFSKTAGLLAVAGVLMLPAFVSAQETATDEEAKPVAIETANGKAVCKLAPNNTKVEFVGTHVGDDPKPRLGGFASFEGTIEVVDGQPNSIEVEFEIASIWTEFDNLTKHLMNADFFEADKFPNASFKSTGITVLGDGNCTIAGELTLHGKTDKIEFPAKFKVTTDGLILTSEFTLDRTRFGMDKMTDGVNAEVSLTVCVGQATRGVESKEGNGSDSNDQAAMDDPDVEGVTVTISLPKMT